MRISDWSSDVCSSDLFAPTFADFLDRLEPGFVPRGGQPVCQPACRPMCRAREQSVDRINLHLVQWPRYLAERREDRKSVVEGKSVSVRLDLGGGRCIKKKTKEKIHEIKNK